MKQVRVIVQFISAEVGGRKNKPPIGVFSAVTTFDDQPRTVRGAWQMAFHFDRVGLLHTGLASWVSDQAPEEALVPGALFSVLEDSHTVARGMII